ncbi:MAG: Hpt domain-containing protein [Oscillospiraceae bacterium]|nr:Hpt domain-containing protein [Oscillospiraceae bacterium]
MLTIDALQSFGVDTKDGLTRCLNNESMYLRLVAMALKDANFDRLSAAIEADDRKAAFEAVHALKGVAGNLGLTPIYETSAEMTELLRAEKDADYPAYLRKILNLRETLRALSDS